MPLSLSSRTHITRSQYNKKYKMEHIKSPEKKISTEVLFMTYYHTATDTRRVFGCTEPELALRTRASIRNQ
jgi:hypothetical protein